MKSLLNDSYVQDAMLRPEDMEDLDKTLYAPKREQLIARQVLPLKEDVPEWAETHKFDKYYSEGSSKIVYHIGDDLPKTVVDDNDHSISIVEIADSYMIAKKRLMAARAQGIPLEDTMVKEVRRNVAEKENTVLFQGDSDANLSGLCDYGGSVTLDNGDWVTGTSDAQKIYEDVKQMAVDLEKQDGDFQARTLILSKSAWEVANTKYFTSGGRRISAYDEIANSDLFDNIYKTSYMSSGVNDVMVLDNREENMAFVLPQDLDSMQPRDRGLYYDVPVWERLGEVLVRYDSSYSEDSVDAIKYPDALTLS